MTKLSILVLLAATACGGGKKSAPASPEPVATEPTATPSEPAPAATEPGAAAVAPTPTAEPAPDPKAELVAAETTAFERAKPVFEKFCASCHQKGGKYAKPKTLGELEITAYPFTGKHANAKDVRKVLGIGGGKPSMPKGKPGAVKGDDLAAIAAWADAWEAADKGGAHAKE